MIPRAAHDGPPFFGFVRMFMASFTRLAALALGVLALCGHALAQVGDRPNLPRDFYEERLRQAGDSLTLCINPAGFMAKYEEEVGKTIADALLLAPKFSFHTPRQITPPLDYRLLFDPRQIFVMLQNNCDGFMGFTLASEGYPGWLRLTRSYLTTRMVLVVKDPAVQSIADLPLDKQIAVRSLSSADNQLIVYLQSVPAERRVKRLPLFDHRSVLEALARDEVSAALIWEPALLAYTRGDPAGAGLHEIQLPFQVPPLEFGIAMRSADTYLRTNIDQAIEALSRDGTLEALAGSLWAQQ